MSERVLCFEDALDEVLTRAGSAAATRGHAIETTELLSGAGRVLAAAVVADRDQPPFDRSTRDGYAVRAADAGKALRIVGSVRAGESWTGAALGDGETIEIMTGAPLPVGADAVVMLEHTEVADGLLRILPRMEAERAGDGPRVGENVVARGAESRSGDVVLPVGSVLGVAEIGVAASCGMAEVQVFARPTVAIVATGDELVELDQPISAAQIRNSNSYTLAALAEASGGASERLQIARDTLEDLRAQIAEGRESDLLLLSGGVSMGKYDLVEQVLSEYDAEFIFTGTLITPGKPTVFGRLPKQNGWTYFFGLPGNPVSAQVCFYLYVAPMLRALAGRTEFAPVFVEARLGEDVQGGSRLTRFLPARLSGSWNGVEVRPVGWHGSGDSVANARGNGYVVLPSGVASFTAGETVRVLLR